MNYWFLARVAKALDLLFFQEKLQNLLQNYKENNALKHYNNLIRTQTTPIRCQAFLWPNRLHNHRSSPWSE